MPYIALYLKAFYKYCSLIIFKKMRGYPQFSFWISITLVQICFSRIFSKRRKNTFELVGTVLNTGIFLRGSKFGIQKERKLWVTMHFSEIIKRQFGKERHTLLSILKLFTNIVD